MKVIKNYIYNVSYQILSIFIALITTPYISRVLGATNIGIYSFSYSIAQYFILFGSIGIAVFAQREIAYNQDRVYDRSKKFWQLFLLRGITVSISLIIYIFIIPKYSNYPMIASILSIEIISTILDISWFFIGMEDFKRITIRNLFVKLVGVICIFLFVKSKNDLPLYTIILSSSSLIGNLSLWISLPKFLVRIKIKDIKIFEFIKPAILLFIPQIANNVYYMLDKPMIGLLSNVTEVGYYEQATKISTLALTIITAMGPVMLSRVAYTYAKKDDHLIITYLMNSIKFVFFLGVPLMLGLMAVAKGVVPWFMGAGFSKSTILIVVLSPLIILIGLTNAIGSQYLLPLDKKKEYSVSVIVGIFINAGMNYFLILKYNAFGAALASVFSEIIVLIIQAYYVRNELPIKTCFGQSKNYFIAGIIMYLFISILVDKILPIAIWSSCVEILVGIIVYMCVLVLLRDQLISKIFNMRKI